MATLRASADSTSHSLRAFAVVGRGPAANVLLTHPKVSQIHAEVRWISPHWFVIDKSRNGTWLDGRRVEAMVEVPIFAGQVLAFGDPEHQWRIEDTDPPSAVASCGDRVVVGLPRSLLLPDDEAPLVEVAYHEFSGWQAVLLAEGGELPIVRERIVVAGETWQLDLPKIIPGTEVPGERNLQASSLEFRRSRDRKNIHLTVVHQGERIEVGEYAFNIPLFALARERMREARAGVTEPGWLEQDELVSYLKWRAPRVHCEIHRARRALLKLGFADGEAIVERRKMSNELRCGVADLVEIVE